MIQQSHTHPASVPWENVETPWSFPRNRVLSEKAGNALYLRDIHAQHGKKRMTPAGQRIKMFIK